MGELRKDPATEEWVIVAPARSSRPRAAGPSPGAAAQPSGPAVDPQCPFCPGNEHRTPPTILREPDDKAAPWRVRVFANLFPVVGEPDAGSPDGEPSSLWASRPGTGAHEVIVDSPHHGVTPADMSVAHMATVLRVYQDRLTALARRSGVEYVALFRNEGRGAGASQPHPHAQIIALPLVPEGVARRWAVAADYRRRHGHCLYCRLLEREAEEGQRWLGANDDAAAFCAFAPRYPFETWIVPRRHRSSMAKASDEELEGLAALLLTVLRALREEAGNPAYNVLFHTGRPLGGDDFHWHVHIAPRLATWAGFELGTGMAVTAQSPEEAAARLRAAMADAGAPRHSG